MTIVDIIDRVRLFKKGLITYDIPEHSQAHKDFAKICLKEYYNCWSYINCLDMKDFSTIEKLLNTLTSSEIELCTQYIQTLDNPKLLEKHTFNIEYKEHSILTNPRKLTSKKRVRDEDIQTDTSKHKRVEFVSDDKTNFKLSKIYIDDLKLDADEDIFGTFYVYYALKDIFFDKHFLNTAVSKIPNVYQARICKHWQGEGLLCIKLNRYSAFQPSVIFETRMKEYKIILESILIEYNRCS